MITAWTFGKINLIESYYMRIIFAKKIIRIIKKVIEIIK